MLPALLIVLGEVHGARVTVLHGVLKSDQEQIGEA